MYYRRKIILGLLEVFDGKLKKTDFQKLLFILSKYQEKPSFEFVPYKYGCFSFQSYADLRTMIKYKLVQEDTNEANGHWIKIDPDKYLDKVNKNDQKLLSYIRNRFSAFSTNELIHYTYTKYPYFAINSCIAEKILTKEELKIVKTNLPQNNTKGLYTIGYEGITQEAYLNRLIKNNILVLCDVRKNSKSMKFGFSKNQLKSACNALGIEYIHIPQLGIESEKRKNLNTQCDYDILFQEYNDNLNKEEKKDPLELIVNLLEQYDRIALTCFEADIHQCHRKHLANKLHREKKEIQVIHI